jgi:hypothetical protein
VDPDESPDIAAEEGFFQRSVAPVSHPPQSSSASRFTAAQAGFFDLRIAAEIVAVQLNQVEGVQEHAGGWNKGKRTDTGGVAEEMREEMMQTRLGISTVVLVLSAGVSVQTALNDFTMSLCRHPTALKAHSRSHEEPIRHPLLEVPDHCRLGSRD